AFVKHLKTVANEKTLVVVTHRPAILDVVDLVAVVEAGRLIAFGPKAQVMAALAGARPAPVPGVPPSLPGSPMPAQGAAPVAPGGTPMAPVHAQPQPPVAAAVAPMRAPQTPATPSVASPYTPPPEQRLLGDGIPDLSM
ncbi:MAG TPA: hypothetical protein PLS22_06200, partial [Aquabacterium sp.]|nr:hypothetical protein [Aquabacterium sp.]